MVRTSPPRRRLKPSTPNKIAGHWSLRQQPGLEGVTFFDPFDTLCDLTTCKLKDKGYWLYADGHHLSRHGSEMVIEDIAGSFDRWMD